ncbi:rod shape-determining protein [Nonomuraea sp. NPDC003727]
MSTSPQTTARTGEQTGRRRRDMGGYAVLDLGTVRTRSLTSGTFAIAERLSAVPAGAPGTTAPSGLRWPIRHGVVADPAACRRLVDIVLYDARLAGTWPLERILVGVPVAATASERRSLRTAVIEAAECPVVLVEEPLAAAVGAGLDVTDPRPCLLLDVGAGVVEAVVIHDGAITDAVALQLSATTRAGLPWPTVDSVVRMTAGLLHRMPAHLRATVRDGGLIVTGGGAGQTRLLNRLRSTLRMPVRVASEPAHATVYGLTHLCRQPGLTARLAQGSRGS